jgi:deoxycytidine triphosphate deaminase
MFLLNDILIRKYLQDKLLGITPFDERLLHPTWYYFRLGAYVNLWDSQEGTWNHVELEESGTTSAYVSPRGYALVRPLEYFSCSKNVLGMFSQASDLALSGLRLNHSLSIDPGFEGVLEMGLENLLDKPAELRHGDIIGKVIFFDISDTSPIHDIYSAPARLAAEAFQRRRNMTFSEPFSSPRRVKLRLRG